MRFELNEYHRNVSDEDLILDLQRVVTDYNILFLTTDVYKKFGKYSKDTISRRFGSWGKALQKAGIKTSKKQIHKLDITRNEILADIKKIYEKNGYITYNLYNILTF